MTSGDVAALEQKTKEIVERLYTIAAHLDDDAEASNYVDADMVASLHVAAHLITSLSERVGELERLWGERCMNEIESQSALSKQGEGP